jgi:hypothetical protein
MITSKQCLAKYGDPVLEKSMTLWDVPSYLEIGAIPKRLYCNRDLIIPLTNAFSLIVSRNLVSQIKTWDGCFNIRRKRGASSQSLHSWGIAIDINAAWNKMGQKPTLSKELVSCFKESGFDWGGDFTTVKDGMHFQLSKI